MTHQHFQSGDWTVPICSPCAALGLPLSQTKYNYYVMMIRKTDITKDPNWKRFSSIMPILSTTLLNLINKAKAATTPVESMLWIRSFEQLVYSHPDLVDRLQMTFKPLYEAARQFDIWA